MKPFIPYISVLAIFLVLFLVSKGSFGKSAAFLRKKLPVLSSYATGQTVRFALMIIFAANLLGAAETFRTLTEDTAMKGYIERGALGEADDTAELLVTIDGKAHDVDLNISSRQMSEAEIEAILDRAEEVLPELVLGELPADHVSAPLMLPEKIEGLPVTVSWMTDRPDVLDFFGQISPSAPEEGTKVTLTAEIICGENLRETGFSVMVFPEETGGEETFLGSIQRAVEEENDVTEERVKLPEMIDGSRASWSYRNADTGKILLLLGFMGAVMFIYSKVRRKELDEEARDMKMRLDYPNIVNKLVLLSSAGMSLRMAFVRIREDYLKNRKRGGAEKPGYEEIVRTSLEMEHGVPEAEAYTHLGQRCRPREYKTLATLLSQSVTRGGSEMNEILKQEAEAAVEERKKRARVLGEEAGTKLLLPMMLMLVVVMVILMVPAFVAFL